MLDVLHGSGGVAAGVRRAAGPRRAPHGVRPGRRWRAGAVVLAAACLGALDLAPARLAAQAPASPFAGVTVSDAQRVAPRALGARTHCYEFASSIEAGATSVRVRVER